MHELRNVIVRMRLGETDRQIARARLMGQHKAGSLRRLAAAQGWLSMETPLPDNEEIAQLLKLGPQAARQTSQVEPFADAVSGWAKRGVSAVAIHAKLAQDLGFTGSYDSVKRFLRRHRDVEPATIILDFKPGEAAQVDFGKGPDLVDRETGEPIKTWFFVMTLAFSRHQYVEFVLDQRVETWLGCHRRALEFFGGVPARMIIDNPKCAITRACYYDPEVQRSYAQYAEGYGFLISTCPVADPCKKGIVESGVKYVKGNFLPLREFRDLTDLNRQVMDWVLETAGNRIHGTTRERPLTRFADAEKDFLKPLPAVPPEAAAWTRLKVHGNCHVAFEKCYYSASFTLVHQVVWLRATEKAVHIYHHEQLVAMHPRLRRPGQRSTIQDHLPPEAQAWLMADPQWCLEQADKIGSHCRAMLDVLFADKVLDKLRAAQGILRLKDKYGAKRLDAACSRALQHETTSYASVKQILARGLDAEPEQSQGQAYFLEAVYRGQARFMPGPNRIQ